MVGDDPSPTRTLPRPRSVARLGAPDASSRPDRSSTGHPTDGGAFYRTTLLGHGTTSYLSGRLLPAGVSTERVHLSFTREGALTVDDHEDGNGIQANSLGAPTQQLGGLTASEFRFRQGPGAFNGSFFGDSTGMVARACGNGREFVQELGGRDLTCQEVWVRVAEVFGPTGSSAPPTGFKLGLRDVGGAESWVDSDEVGGVRRPFPRNPATMKTTLTTFRFRTGCFTVASGLDLTAVAAIMITPRRTSRTSAHTTVGDAHSRVTGAQARPERRARAARRPAARYRQPRSVVVPRSGGV